MRKRDHIRLSVIPASDSEPAVYRLIVNGDTVCEMTYHEAVVFLSQGVGCLFFQAPVRLEDVVHNNKPDC